MAELAGPIKPDIIGELGTKQNDYFVDWEIEPTMPGG